jgi:endonuclease-3
MIPPPEDPSQASPGLASPLQIALIEKLIRLHPDTAPFLESENPFQLLVAVILSAQCTDAKVNEVTRVLFRAFPTPTRLAGAPLADVEKIVYPTGFYREKAAHIVETSQLLLERHGGEVPLSMEELTALPGVGRKTANVIRGQVGGLPAVIVDTHFKRVTKRLGLTQQDDPGAIERELAALVPLPMQFAFSMAANRHGRVYCHARVPRCGDCPVQKLCPSG